MRSDKIALSVDSGAAPARGSMRAIFTGFLIAFLFLALPLALFFGIFMGTAKGTWTSCSTSLQVPQLDSSSSCYHAEQLLQRSEEFKSVNDPQAALAAFTTRCLNQHPAAMCNEINTIAARVWTPGAVTKWCEGGFPSSYNASASSTRRRLWTPTWGDTWRGVACAGATVGAIAQGGADIPNDAVAVGACGDYLDHAMDHN